MKKYRRLLILLTLVLGVIAIFVCVHNESPTKIVEKNLKQIQCGEENEFIKSAISEVIIKDAEGYEELEQEIVNAYKGIEYELIKEEINSDKAIVNVSVEGPDIQTALRQAMMDSLSDMDKNPVGNNFSMEDAHKRVKKYSIEGVKQAEKKKQTIEFKLSKEENKWILDNDDKVFEAILGE